MLRSAVGRVKLFWENIATLVDKAPISADEKNRLKQYTVFLLMGVPTMIVYGLYNLIRF